MSSINFTKLNPIEDFRIYHFENGAQLKIENVCAIYVSSRGTHRLETTEGFKFIISPKWLAIEISTDAWSF